MSLNFNPVEYMAQMKIIGFGLTALGIILLVLTAIVATNQRQNNKLPVEDSRD